MWIFRKIKSKIFNSHTKEYVSELKYSDFTETELKIYNTVKDYTLTSPERIISLLRAVEYITKAEIEGDIVECGVWKGGSMMAVAKQLLLLNSTVKTLYLYDTFEGMSEPTKVDIAVNKVVAKDYLDNLKYQENTEDDIVRAYSPLDIVEKNLFSTEYPKDKIKFIKGEVEKTIPFEVPKKIAILRLDTDWYESTKHELIHLFPLLSTRGVLIIDDYGHWEGCKKAVDEYFGENKINLFLNRIDYTSRLAIKL
jgi:O-methyltransferase